MLKYQVRTLGRDRRRQSNTIPLRDVFSNKPIATDSNRSISSSTSASISAPNSPWHDLTRRRGRSTSVSSLSSASTSSESTQDWATIRIYTCSIRPDTDYKTVFTNVNTTAGELINSVLNKFRIHFKDPDLFYLMMELMTRHEGGDIRHSVPLDSNAKPLVLQACYPADRCRFELKTRHSFPVRIYDCTSSNYKTLMVSRQTTCAEAVSVLVKVDLTPTSAMSMSMLQFDFIDDNSEETMCHDPSDFGITLYDSRTRKEIMLHPEESIFTALYESGHDGQYQLHMRPLRRRHLDTAGSQHRREAMSTLTPLYDDDHYSRSTTLRDCVL